MVKGEKGRYNQKSVKFWVIWVHGNGEYETNLVCLLVLSPK